MVATPDVILWQNENGQASLWGMNGDGSIAGVQVPLNLEDPHPGNAVGIDSIVGGGFGLNDILAGGISLNPGPSTHAIGTDGGSDILFQNTNGQASIWDMSGNTLVGGGPVGPNPGPNWRAVGLSTSF
jgi:hypothetical protein